MRSLRISIACLLVLAATALSASAASAAPAWRLDVNTHPTVLEPGGTGTFQIVAANVGDSSPSGTVTITDTLPAGLTVTRVLGEGLRATSPPFCTTDGQAVSCESNGPHHPGFWIKVDIEFDVNLPDGSLITNTAEISGGGGAAYQASTQTEVSAVPPPFDFLLGESGFAAPVLDPDGTAATSAGSHPATSTVALDFPTTTYSQGFSSPGHLRDAIVDLPPGLLANPAATPVLCTEAQLSDDTQGGGTTCPPESQVGTVTINTAILKGLAPQTSALYNMVPPPGAPAAFATDIGGFGIYPHIIGELRSDSDYGVSGIGRDILARNGNPVFGVAVELWGDPSSQAYDFARDMSKRTCPTRVGDECPVDPFPAAFLTSPTHCPGTPDIYHAEADSWEQPGEFKHAVYESADLAGNPAEVAGCNSLQFEPKISSQPTTNLTDSPSGLHFNLNQPQNTEVEGRSSAALRDATITFPAGISVNASQADGLAACSLAQIGYAPDGAEIHFSKQPAACPDASKLGTLRVTSPLLAARDADHKLLTDPESGETILEPLGGAVYLAEPFANPFDSLIAVYLAIESPRYGIVAKLAGEGRLDPASGQITTSFAGNPQLPITDFRVDLFEGARAPLITPPTCAPHTTTSTLTPWSSPEGADAHPTDSFTPTGSPDGGACPATEPAAPHAPAFSAGTISPQAGAFSPFLLKLSRADGSQRLAQIEATLPPGLAARFAGVASCSEAEIAAATARGNPEQGILERQSPSCPEASRLGTVTVAAGAGPTPLHVQGTAYLAGPYKSAPLSMAIITPAIAGPFDLGTVVVRTALYVDPETAQGRAVSDPLPAIIDGVPLDVRSVAVRLDRPNFTLNPTSCDPLAITAAAVSTLQITASLQDRFQVGGCATLPFRPRLSLRLKGATRRASNPRLIATLKAKPGEANIAKAQVKLPVAAFLDNSHIKTICTRVQFAADSCPPGSVYGKASATTPLLDYPVSGPVYLRSSSNPLPDLVVKLRGPETQPIEVHLLGVTDSVKGALRNTFRAVPDAPVSRFRLELFGGKRGLVELSRNLCKARYRAEVRLDGQNGKVHDTRPLVGNSCKNKKGGGRGGRGR